jgi:hypothetical protein
VKAFNEVQTSESENGMLLKDEYIWLSELGYIKTNGDYDGYFKSSWQIVTLASNDVKEKLLANGGYQDILLCKI